MKFFKDFFFLSGTLDFLKSFKDGSTFEWVRVKTLWFTRFYKQVFFGLFLIANIVFLIHTTNFLFGNHDYSAVKNGAGIVLWYGRYTNALPLQLCGGYLSPVLNNLLSIACMAASAMLLCVFCHMDDKKIDKRVFLSICLVPMLLPHIMTWFYYSYETFSHTMLPALTIGALWTVRDKINIERAAVSIFLVWFSMGIYPSVLSLFFLAIGAQIIYDLTEKETIRTILFRCLRFAGIILLGSVLFKVTIGLLRKLGKTTSEIYSLSMPEPLELVRKFIPELILSVKQFFHPTPYIPVSLKLLLLAIIVIAVVLTAWKAFRKSDTFLEKATRSAMVIAVWGGMFFATMLPDYLSKDDFAFVIRTGYFGMPFLILIGLVFIFRIGNKPLTNVVLCLTWLILWCSAISDLEIQKNWKIGFQNEVLQYSRVLAMMEQSPEVFSLKQPINYLQVGSLPSGRTQFCRPKIEDGIDSFELHGFEFNPDWSPRAGIILEYLGSDFKFNHRCSFRVDEKEIESFFDTKSARFLEFLKGARAYPAPPEQCLFVDPESNSLVIVLNDKVLKTVKEKYGVQ